MRKLVVILLTFIAFVCLAFGIAACSDDGEQADSTVISVEKTSTDGLVDTYTITFADNTTSTFTVTNGEDGDTGDKGAAGEQGVGVQSTKLDEDGNLIIMYTNGETQTLSHNWKFAYTLSEATAVADGLSIYTCSDCGLAKLATAHYKGELQKVCTSNMNGVFRSAIYECAACGEEFCDTLEYADLNVPIVDFSGSLDGVSKETKVKVSVEYTDGSQKISCDATLKVQGSTSAYYPKKNYTLQLYKSDTSYKTKNKVTLVSDWGEQSKYCLKANWVDYSQSRNVVSGKLYSQIAKTRTELTDGISQLANSGVVDGYPVLVYVNGEYMGLYTMNIPKDEWMFGMGEDETAKQAILMADGWSASTSLREHVADDFSNGWELEYCSTEDTDASWVVTSFNNMMDFINNSDDETFKSGISTYVNVERAIDAMIYTIAISAYDNTSKNILWVTYDGTQWIPSVYDMDDSWGLNWSGTGFNSIEVPFYVIDSDGNNITLRNNLWTRLYGESEDVAGLYREEINARYAELRASVLSVSNVDKTFSDFFAQIPVCLYESESEKWTGVPSQDTNSFSQIIAFAEARLEYLDGIFGYTSAETVYKADITCSEGVSVKVFMTQDYTAKSDLASVAFARDSETGLLSTNDGQINFEIVLEDGYELVSVDVNSVDVAEGSKNYKNLKEPSDIGRAYTYRITKITGDLTISVTARKT